MNNNTSLFRRCATTAALALGAMATAAHADLVDIGNSPVVVTSAGSAKPNIMLLMDASDSMAWTHMPDEVEAASGGVPGRRTIGYKSPQCNTLYFDPSRSYSLPKDHLGNYFPTPEFIRAPFNGFGLKIQPNDDSRKNLTSEFQAYDTRSLLVSGSQDTPQEAYYYTHSTAGSLDPTGPACKQGEVAVADDVLGQATIAANGGGTWTRHRVRDTALRDKFAVWYSYYRKRIYLIKSAASLAFTPLTDTFRVGFITVQPKQSEETNVDLEKFLALNDFNAIQREDWFNKLFAQVPDGASPAREGLARVGRYYAGKFDGINQGIPAVDPLQYSCQQNFTIMTTDGYWNSQTESRTGGGPRDIGGNLITQEDGDPSCTLDNPYCPRPIYDGHGNSRRIDATAEVVYDQMTCGIGSKRKYVYENTKARTFFAVNFEKTQRRTQEWRLTFDQDMKATWQTTKLQSRLLQTTEQFRERRDYVETTRRYRIEKSTWQHTQTKSQVLETASQDAIRVWQVRRQELQHYQTQTQFKRDRVQWRETREQQWKERRRFVEEVRQQNLVEYRRVGKPVGQETYEEVKTCPVGWTCKIEDRTSTPVPFGSCPTPGQSDSAPFWITECESGPATTAPQNVAACTYGTTPRDAGMPSHTRTICSDEPVDAAAPVPFGDCNAGSIDPTTKIRTLCSTPGGTGNGVFVGVASTCDAKTGRDLANGYVKVTCTKSIDDVSYPDTACTSTTESPNITITCSTLIDTRGYYAGACASPGFSVSGNNVRTNCTNTLATSAIAASPSDCPVGDAGPVTTTQVDTSSQPYSRICTRVYSRGSDAAPEVVQDCPGSNVVGSVETQCSLPAANNYVDRAVPWGSCSSRSGTSAPYITVGCSYPFNNTVLPAAPSGADRCVDSDGVTASPYVKVVCNGRTRASGPVNVLPSACSDGFTAASPWTETTCQRINLPAPDLASCVPGNSGDPDYIETECIRATPDQPVASCAPPFDVWTGPAHDRRYCYKPPATNQVDERVASCTRNTSPTEAQGYIYVTCRDDPTLPAPAFVDASTCPAGIDAPTGTNNFVRTECRRVQQTADTAVQLGTCRQSYGSGSDWIETECKKGPAFDPVGRLERCTQGPAPIGAPWIVTTCTPTDVTDYTVGAGFPGACTRESSGGREVGCTGPIPAGAGQLGALACTDYVVDAAATEPVTARCGVKTVIPAVSSPPCTSGISGNEYLTCAELPPVVTVDATCQDGQSGAFRTRCEDFSTGGLILRSKVVDTETNTRVSGDLGLADPVSTRNESRPWTPITSCLAADDPAVALPPTRLATVTELPLPTDRRDPPEDNHFSCPGDKWPCSKALPGPGGSIGSLADVAAYYYKTDLRTGANWDNNVIAAGARPEGDWATHQHMTTFVVGMGVSGTLRYDANYKSMSNTLGDFPKIRCLPPAVATAGRGCTDWPVWPDPNLTYASTDDYNHPKSIDDFWHTAVNGRGTYFSAKDPDSLVSGLSEALNSIGDVPASGAGEAASSFEPTSATANYAYVSSYRSGDQRTGGGWTGDLQKFSIKLTDASLDEFQWSAADLLGAKAKPTCDRRNIYLARPGGQIDGTGPAENAVAFTADTSTCDIATNLPVGSPDTSLNAEELEHFGATDETRINQLSQWTTMSAAQKSAARGANLVNFIRGQRGFEGYVANNTAKLFRFRSGVLGDLIQSQPVYVGAPFARYQDAGYADFITTRAAREPMVYVGGNDGMLHAFSGVDGDEKWALIPRTVLPNLFRLADFNYKNIHRYYVDGSPVVGDIKDATGWRTILVVGMNAGGKGYIAVDVTDPTKPPTVLWEFQMNTSVCPTSLTGTGSEGYTSDCNLGLTFGKPVITKLANEWVVLLTSGYNNRNGASSNDGKGFLYVLRASDGVMLQKINTGKGDSGTPSGLAQISNFVENTFVDNTTVRAYGGDLEGNVFRFEFIAPGTAQLLGTAKRAGVAQPITTRPEIAELGSRPIIFVGTGKLLGPTDVSGPQTPQSVYGIVDPLTSGPTTYEPLRDSLRPLEMVQTGTGPTATRTVRCTDTTACQRAAGWVLDLPEDGERVNVNMNLNFGTLIVASNVPEAASCSVGGHGWINYLDFRTGLVAQGRPLINTGNPSLGASSSSYVSGSMIAGFNVYRLPGPNSRFSVGINKTNKERQVDDPPPPSPEPTGKRISWREIAR